MVLFSFYVEVFVENACVCIRLIGPTYVVVLFIWLFAVFTVMLLGWSSRLSMWINLILSYLIMSPNHIWTRSCSRLAVVVRSLPHVASSYEIACVFIYYGDISIFTKFYTTFCHLRLKVLFMGSKFQFWRFSLSKVRGMLFTPKKHILARNEALWAVDSPDRTCRVVALFIYQVAHKNVSKFAMMLYCSTVKFKHKEITF